MWGRDCRLKQQVTSEQSCGKPATHGRILTLVTIRSGGSSAKPELSRKTAPPSPPPRRNPSKNHFLSFLLLPRSLILTLHHQYTGQKKNKCLYSQTAVTNSLLQM